MARALWGLLSARALWGLLLLLPAVGLSAQLQRVVHQTLEVPDSVARIELDLTDSYTAANWPMQDILIESRIKLYNCNQNILDYLIEAGRFRLDLEALPAAWRLAPSPMRQDPIRVASGGCREEVEHRFYMPVDFRRDSLGRWSHPGRPSEVQAVPLDTLENPQPRQR